MWAEELVIKSDDLRSIPGTHKAGGENQLLQVVLTIIISTMC